MTTAPEQHATDLQEYLRIVRARKYEVALITIALLAGTLLFSFRQTPIYEGQVKVLIKPLQNPAVSGVSVAQAPNLDTERELILSQAVAQKVREDLELGTTADAILQNVSVQVVADTEVLTIKYAHPDPASSARLANAFAKAYVDFRSEQALDAYETAATAVQKRIDSIQGGLEKLNRQIDDARDPELETTLRSQRDALVAQLGVLQQRLFDLQSTATVAQDAAQIIQPAAIPGSAASPDKVRDGVLALVAGLALGVGFALLRERLDDRVKSRQELERYLGAPVIAAVPRVTAWRKHDEAHLVMRADPKSPQSEAYRTLGTNIQYLASRQPLRIIMITSPLMGDGKSSTAANLSVVLARAGKRVVLISADLRRPRTHLFFGIRNNVGLSNVLSDSISLAEATRDPGVPNLRVVSAGPVPNDPAALLGSSRAAELLDSIREISDFAIVDTPPVLAVADASILAPLVDGTILVMDAERSSRSAMVHARNQLENAGANILGAVYNNFDPSKSASYPSYGYYSQYYGVADGGSRDGRRRRTGRRGKRSKQVPVWEEAGPTSGRLGPRAGAR